MPSSSSLGKQFIKEWFEKQEFCSVLDLGVGEGTYRKLLGNECYWSGIEIYEPYVKKYKLRELYDELIVGDITKVELSYADCVIAGDVLEHLEKEEAIKLVNKFNYLFGNIVLSIPIDYEQEPVGDNPYEEHKSIWTWKELDKIISPKFKIRKQFGNIAIFIK